MDTKSNFTNHFQQQQQNPCSLDNALLDCNLIYDPKTKKLCLKNPDTIVNNKQGKIQSISNTLNGSTKIKNGFISDHSEYSLQKNFINKNDLKNENLCANSINIQENRRISTDSDIINEYYKTFDGNVPIHSIKRPNNLPPKSKHEERKHREQFLEILKNAKIQDLKKKNLQKVISTRQVQQEKEIQKAIKLWSDEIIPCWTSSHITKRVQDLWWHGIPSSIRPKVWNMVIGNDLNITEQLFYICVKRSKEKIWTKQFLSRRSSNPQEHIQNSNKKTHRRTASHSFNENNTDSQALDPNVLKESLENLKLYDNYEYNNYNDNDDDDDCENIAFLIKLDVLRTFPQLGLFQETGPYHESLCDILSAYVVYRPDIGYCQGMSFLAAMLLLNSQSPSSAFISLANLLNNDLLLAFYSMNQDKMKIIYSYYDRQFRSLLPNLAQHFVNIGLTTDLFFMYQVYTIFARSLSLDCVSRVWDLFLRDGNEFIFRASLAILSMYQKELIHLEFIDSAKFLSNLPDEMDTEKYFETIASIKLIPPNLSTLLLNDNVGHLKKTKYSFFTNKFLRF